MKREKQPGENMSLKTRKTEHPAVMAWLNAQSNLMDSLRYLIEREVEANGVRNLQTFIPSERMLNRQDEEASKEIRAGAGEIAIAATAVRGGADRLQNVPDSSPERDHSEQAASPRSSDTTMPALTEKEEEAEADDDDIAAWS